MSIGNQNLMFCRLRPDVATPCASPQFWLSCSQGGQTQRLALTVSRTYLALANGVFGRFWTPTIHCISSKYLVLLSWPLCALYQMHLEESILCRWKEHFVTFIYWLSARPSLGSKGNYTGLALWSSNRVHRSPSTPPFHSGAPLHS